MRKIPAVGQAGRDCAFEMTDGEKEPLVREEPIKHRLTGFLFFDNYQ